MLSNDARAACSLYYLSPALLVLCHAPRDNDAIEGRAVERIIFRSCGQLLASVSLCLVLVCRLLALLFETIFSQEIGQVLRPEGPS